MNKQDIYVYYHCVDGYCPLIVEEEIYGIRSSNCEDYCGKDFVDCKYCFFNGSSLCSECIHSVI